MNKPFGNDDPALAAYVTRTYAPEDEILREIRERSARAGLPDIQLAALDARHLEILAGLPRPPCRRSGCPGRLLRRVDPARPGARRHARHDRARPQARQVARESFRKSGFSARARVHVGPAKKVLPRLAKVGPFDFCFIDADKEGYPLYLDWAANNLRRAGLVVLDNAFLFGRLAKKPAGKGGAEIAAMQKTHDLLAHDGRFRATVLPTGEGMAVGVKI
jgi:caffeoyl-CoA O-methyltransferase